MWCSTGDIQGQTINIGYSSDNSSGHSRAKCISICQNGLGLLSPKELRRQMAVSVPSTDKTGKRDRRANLDLLC